MSFVFSESARRDVLNLPKKVQRRLRDKLLFWQSLEDPLSHAQSLTQHEATHRFRFGAYRILVKKDDTRLLVLRVRRRKEVYR